MAYEGPSSDSHCHVAGRRICCPFFVVVTIWLLALHFPCGGDCVQLLALFPHHKKAVSAAPQPHSISAKNKRAAAASTALVVPAISAIAASSGASSADANNALDVHFGLCGGMFNCHFELVAMLNLLSETVPLLNPKGDGATAARGIRLRMPPFEVSHLVRGPQRLSFSRFYDLTHMQTLPGLKSMGIADQIEPCPHILSLQRGMDRRTFPSAFAKALKSWRYKCIFLQKAMSAAATNESGGFGRKCSWFLVNLDHLRESGQGLVSNRLRFHPWRNELAVFARAKLPATFYAIHLRLEAEYMRAFAHKLLILNGAALDLCLLSKGGKGRQRQYCVRFVWRVDLPLP